MDKLSVTAAVLLCVIVYGMERISSEVAEMRVKPGDNVTLQCNSSMDASVIEWHRNCSHVNQPKLSIDSTWAPPRFSVTQNDSTKFSTLRIENITEGDLGIYYCSSALHKGEAVQTFKVTFQETLPVSPSCPPADCGHCWMLLVSLCPISVLLCIISCTCVYCLTHEKESKKTFQTISGIEDPITNVIYRNMK